MRSTAILLSKGAVSAAIPVPRRDITASIAIEGAWEPSKILIGNELAKREDIHIAAFPGAFALHWSRTGGMRRPRSGGIRRAHGVEPHALVVSASGKLYN
jgi:hypothetical protein